MTISTHISIDNLLKFHIAEISAYFMDFVIKKKVLDIIVTVMVSQ